MEKKTRNEMPRNDVQLSQHYSSFCLLQIFSTFPQSQCVEGAARVPTNHL